jgi:hypothetical protein
MPAGFRRALIFAAALAVLLCAVAFASVQMPVFAIPGFADRGLQVATVSRLSDGGALLAGSMSDRAQSPRWRPVLVRLLLDGSIDLAYGNLGISQPRLGPSTRAISLAANPGSADAWVGVIGPQQRGGIIALNGTGSRQKHFGRGGILQLGADNAPVALAWAPGQLLIASGSKPCAGCQLTVVNPSTGQVTVKGTIALDGPAVSKACARGAVTSAVLVGGRTVQLAFLGGKGCAAQIVTVTISRSGRQASLNTTVATPLTLPSAPTASLDAAFGSSICAAASSQAKTVLGALSARAFSPLTAPGGRLAGLVALGGGACAGLITTASGFGGVVVQASGTQRSVTRDTVPGSVRPLSMFRCHAHLLVIGARARPSGVHGMVVVIPVRRGPGAGAMSADVALASGRCAS